MSEAHSFFGELYLRSTRPFQSDDVAAAEAAFIARRLAPQLARGPVLDLGCGHGRHLGRLQGDGALVLGVDLDPTSLSEAKELGPVVRGDFFRLPFRDGAMAAIVSWYNSIFTFKDDELRRILAEVHRCLRPEGVLLLQGTNVEGPRRTPESTFDGPLPDGSHLREDCRFDAAGSRDELTRRLELPDGRILVASFFIRYFGLDGLTALLAEAGLEVLWSCGAIDGSPVTLESPDLIVGAKKRG